MPPGRVLASRDRPFPTRCFNMYYLTRKPHLHFLRCYHTVATNDFEPCASNYQLESSIFDETIRFEGTFLCPHDECRRLRHVDEPMGIPKVLPLKRCSVVEDEAREERLEKERKAEGKRKEQVKQTQKQERKGKGIVKRNAAAECKRRITRNQQQQLPEAGERRPMRPQGPSVMSVASLLTAAADDEVITEGSGLRSPESNAGEAAANEEDQEEEADDEDDEDEGDYTPRQSRTNRARRRKRNHRPSSVANTRRERQRSSPDTDDTSSDESSELSSEPSESDQNNEVEATVPERSIADRVKSRRFGNEALDDYNGTLEELSDESAVEEVRGKKVGKDSIGNILRKRKGGGSK